MNIKDKIAKLENEINIKESNNKAIKKLEKELQEKKDLLENEEAKQKARRYGSQHTLENNSRKQSILTELSEKQIENRKKRSKRGKL